MLFPRTIALLALCLAIPPLFPQSAENVLLVVNEASPISLDVGAYRKYWPRFSESISYRAPLGFR
jgi:hypothetical protein